MINQLKICDICGLPLRETGRGTECMQRGCGGHFIATMRKADSIGPLDQDALAHGSMMPASWREKPVADLAANLCQYIHSRDRLKAMTNAELVRECTKTDAADWDIVNEMMTRLHPGWENEPS